jgi:hypothetical protein
MATVSSLLFTSYGRLSSKLYNIRLAAIISSILYITDTLFRGADKSLARPGRKQATATEYFEFHTSYL